jgi:hypothetical protein
VLTLGDVRPSIDKHRGRRRVLLAAGVALGIALVLELVFGPFSLLVDVIRVAVYRRELLAAEARWESRGVVDYDIEGSILVPPMCMYDVSLEVRGSDLVSATVWQSMPNSASPEEAMLSFWREYCPPNAEYTIGSMLARVETDLRRLDLREESVRVDFDPQYGFVTRYEHRHYGGRGLLTRYSVGDCCIEYLFSGFQSRGVSTP